MRVAMVTEPYKVEVKEMERPNIGPEDVFIKVKAAGICGSDLHLFKGTHAFRKPPAIVGHEVAGEIIEIGKEVEKFKVGDRVTVEPQIGCGECENCMDGYINLCKSKIVPGTSKWGGTFSEYFLAPAKTVYKLADSVSYDIGVLVEPLAVAVHAVRQFQRCKGSIAILGSGTIGLLCLIVAKQYGFKHIICSDTVKFNLEMAKKFGAEKVINPLETDVFEEVKRFTNGELLDASLVAAGAENIVDEASSIVKRRGEIVLVAMITEKIPVYTYSLVFNEQTLHGTMTYQTEDFAEAVRMINEGLDLSSFITQKLPMNDTQKGMEILNNKSENVVKILVYPE